MVKYAEPALDATFGALSDPTRRAILAQLARGESSVTQLASRFEISLPGVTKHLRVLESAGLLRSSKRGRVRRCRLRPEPMKDAAEWIQFYRRFWEDQFESLAEFIEEMKKEDVSWRPRVSHPKSSKSAGRFPRRKRKSSRRGRNRN